MAFFQK